MISRILSILFSIIITIPAFAQPKPEIRLGRLNEVTWPSVEDDFNGSICSFYLANPEGSGSERDTVLAIKSIERPDIDVVINGNITRLRWAPKMGKFNRSSGFSMPPGGTWSNGKFTLELHCEQTGEGDSQAYLKGIIEIRSRSIVKRIKVAGVCGC